MEENKKTIKAFPNTTVNKDGIIISGQEGMDLRDYFANSAMGSQISANTDRACHGMEFDDNTIEYLVKESYRIADAMLKFREETKI